MHEGLISTIDPRLVRFSQDSIRFRFSEGGTIDDLAQDLRSGRVRPDDVPPIRLVERAGQLFTLDNRRLEAFRRAEMDVPFRMATPDETEAARWKFTTTNGGVSVRVRQHEIWT